ncbi:MAG: protein kinase [Myxococcales bacterium]|nr:protein kinase [Myxococcales bacterium]
MSSGPTGEDAETAATDAGIASDETIDQEAAQSTPQHVTTGRVIRVSRASLGPSRLGRYAIVRPLGRGGMGAVFEAEDPELGRRVAIKVLRDDRNAEHFTESLRREAQALAKLVHPNVVGVYDVGVDDGQVFVVMQLIEGESIDRWLGERRARVIEIVDAFRQAGKGLAAAHAAGLVHCDFKPSNVLVDKDGVIRVSDFGLARIGAEDTASIAGTPAYMAPEQFTGVATSASDQYAFCVALFEVLTGAPPFRDSKIQDADAAQARIVPPIPRSVPAYIARALQRGLARDSTDRFPSMEALLAALAPPMRQRWLFASGVALVAIAGAVVAVVAMRAPAAVERKPEPPPPARPDLAAAHALTKYGTAACAYAPSIDGNRIVFDRTEGDAVDLYEMPLAGGPPRQLTSAPTWEWRSNPGRHPGEVIHLIHDPKVLANAKIAYLDVASGNETLAATVTAADAGVTTNGVVYIPRSGEELRRITAGRDVLVARAPDGLFFNQLAISHGGDRIAAIAFNEKASSVCVIDAATSTRNCAETRALPFRPAFGAGDRRLYYAALDGIHGRDLATGQDALIIPDVSPQGGLAIAADGHALVYSDCGTRSQILDWQTQPPTLVLDDPTATDPTGISTNVLVWLRVVRGTSVLVARTRDRGEVQLSDPDFGSISSPAISPDATRVVFRSGAPHAGIYVATLELGVGFQRITDNSEDRRPVWIGSDMLAFTRYDDRKLATIYAANSDGGNLHPLPGSSRFTVGGRDHRVLVATTTQLHWLDADTGAEHDAPALPLQGSDPHTSPNGKWLIVRSGPEGQLLQRMSLVPPGKIERLAPVPSGQTIDGAAITDDGHLLVGAQTWSGDLHVVPAKLGAPY